MQYSGAGVFVISKNDIILVRDQTKMFTDFGGSIDSKDRSNDFNQMLVKTAQHELFEESRCVLKLNEGIFRGFVDITTGNGTLYRSYIVSFDRSGLCTQFKQNASLVSGMGYAFNETTDMRRFNIAMVKQAFSGPESLFGRFTGHQTVNTLQAEHSSGGYEIVPVSGRVKRIIRAAIDKGLI